MKNNKNFHNDGTVQISNRKFAERNKVDPLYTQIHHRSLSWLGTGSSIKRGGVKNLPLGK